MMAERAADPFVGVFGDRPGPQTGFSPPSAQPTAASGQSSSKEVNSPLDPLTTSSGSYAVPIRPTKMRTMVAEWEGSIAQGTRMSGFESSTAIVGAPVTPGQREKPELRRRSPAAVSRPHAPTTAVRDPVLENVYLSRTVPLGQQSDSGRSRSSSSHVSMRLLAEAEVARREVELRKAEVRQAKLDAELAAARSTNASRVSSSRDVGNALLAESASPEPIEAKMQRLRESQNVAAGLGSGRGSPAPLLETVQEDIPGLPALEDTPLRNQIWEPEPPTPPRYEGDAQQSLLCTTPSPVTVQHLQGELHDLCTTPSPVTVQVQQEPAITQIYQQTNWVSMDNGSASAVPYEVYEAQLAGLQREASAHQAAVEASATVRIQEATSQIRAQAESLTLHKDAQIAQLQQQLLDAEAVRRSEVERAYADGGLAAPKQPDSTTAASSSVQEANIVTPKYGSFCISTPAHSEGGTPYVGAAFMQQASSSSRAEFPHQQVLIVALYTCVSRESCTGPFK